MRRIFGVIFFSLFPLVVWGVPYSDLARDDFEKGPSVLSSEARNPFAATRQGESIQPATLRVQGIVLSKNLRLGLLSGWKVREGDPLGPYLVKEIAEDHVDLVLGEQVYNLRVDNYLQPVPAKKVGNVVAFYEASLRDALGLLAKAAGLNVILPNVMPGAVSVNFRGTDLVEAMESIVQANGYHYIVDNGIYRIGKSESFAAGSDLKTRMFKLEYATAKDLADRIKKIMSDKGNVMADERSNVLTVRDYEPIVQNIEKLVAMVDQKDLQVHLEGRIVDATTSFSRSMGIQWSISDSPGGRFQTSGTSEVGRNSDTNNPFNVNLGAASPSSGVGMILGRLAGGLRIEAKLSAAEQKGDIKIISRPSVTTVNNLPAKIRSGAKIYVKSTSTISVGTASGTGGGEQSGLQEIDTGIELTVTPQISSDDLIRLKIDAKESEPDFSKTVDGIPSVLDNSASTTVLLVDEETVVIGGLYKVSENKQRRSVPGFSRVPLLGHLFKTKSKTKDDRELLIFITPKVIRM